MRKTASNVLNGEGGGNGAGSNVDSGGKTPKVSAGKKR